MAAHEINLTAGLVTTVGVVGEFEVPANEEGEAKVVSITYLPATSLAAEGVTNFAKLQVRNFTANPASPVVVGTLDFSTTALTAETETDFVLSAATSPSTGSGPVAATHVNEDDVLDVFVVQTGTGGVFPAGTVVIETQ